MDKALVKDRKERNHHYQEWLGRCHKPHRNWKDNKGILQRIYININTNFTILCCMNFLYVYIM